MQLYTTSYGIYFSEVLATYTGCIIVTIVLLVQFTSTSFSGSESSGEVLVTVALSGGVDSSNVTIFINLNGITATGHLLYLCDKIRICETLQVMISTLLLSMPQFLLEPLTLQ